MLTKHLTRLSRLILMLTAATFLAGCSGAQIGDQSEELHYYDLYMDRPGYYDFGRPVISMPDG